MIVKIRKIGVVVLTASLGSPMALRAQEAPASPAQEPPASPDRPVLELTLDDTVKRALENNIDIAVERYRPEASGQTVRQALGVYEPVLFSTISKRSQTSPATNAFTGAAKLESDTATYNFGATQYFPTGATLRVDFNNNRQDTNSVFTTFNPAYNSVFNLNFSQPLLRDFTIDQSRLQIRVAKRNREISDVQFRQTVVNTVASVRQMYYDLIYAIDNLEAQRKSLTLAKKLLDENQIKVRVGTMAPLDVVQAESEVASREEGVLVAEAAVADAEDAIKRAIFPKNEPENWQTRIVPTDHPTADPIEVDTEAAITTAIEKRTDIVAARKGLENAETNLRFARNQVLPAVDLVASYGATGLSGTQILDPVTRTPLAVPIPGGFGTAVSDVFSRDFPTWTVGVNVTYPLLTKTSRATAAIARVNRDQTLASIRRLEIQVTAEVRSAARAVETNFKRVQSGRAARVLAERRLDAEEKRFAAGMQTAFFVTQAQRDLALAEVTELRAIADYRKSLVNFERVQEAGVGGSGGVATVSGSSSSLSGGSSSSSSSSQSSSGGQQ
jgi:outer membrane protein